MYPMDAFEQLGILLADMDNRIRKLEMNMNAVIKRLEGDKK